MKIAFILPHYKDKLPGGYRVILEYIEQLCTQHQITLLLPYYAHVAYGNSLKSCGLGLFKQLKRFGQAIPPFVKGQWKSHPSILSLNPKIHIQSPFKLSSRHLQNQDLVIGSWWETADFLLKHKSSAQKIHFCQGYEMWGGDVQAVAAIYENPNIHLITISTWLRNQILHHHHKESFLLTNALDWHTFCKINQPKPYDIGLVLRSSEKWKGVDLALKVLSQLDSSIKVCIASFEPLNLADYSCQISTVLCHSKEEIKDFYNSCSIFVNLSLSEGFGLTIAEAMACECVVISTPVGCAVDFIKHEINGFIAQGFSENEILLLLKKALILSTEERQNMGLLARQEITQISLADQVKALESHLNQVLNNAK